MRILAGIMKLLEFALSSDDSAGPDAIPDKNMEKY
jgi:hypothetical protein